MPVTFSCPHCGHRLLLHDELGVTSRRCSACGRKVKAPSAEPASATRKSQASAARAAADIQTGHLDYFLDKLAEQHHALHQMKRNGGKHWQTAVLAAAEVVHLVRQYSGKLDIYVEEASFPQARALCVSLFPRGANRGCLYLAGLALPTDVSAWLRKQGLTSAEGLRFENSPMDGRTVQIDFTATVRHDARRPKAEKYSPDGLSMAFRERLYTLGWDRQEIEMKYFGVQHTTRPPAPKSKGKAGPAPRRREMTPREQAILQDIFACNTGAKTLSDAKGAVEAVLAVPDSSRVFASEVVDVLDAYKDAHLVAVFGKFSMLTVPLNDKCKKYFQKAEQDSPTLTGPDPRMITLTFTLAALAEAHRSDPARELARKVIGKFMDKCRRGATLDNTAEWHIARWGQVYYTAAAAILMKKGVEQYTWALPILDAVTLDHRHVEETLYWRAVAAYRYWLLKPSSPNRIRMATQRLNAIIRTDRKHRISPDRMSKVREYLDRMGVSS